MSQVTLTGNLITDYGDLDFKNSVRVATTAAGTLASDFEAGDTVDGVVLVAGDRILLKDQASGAENGIYVVQASGAPVRATDADSDSDVTAGMSTIVTEGTANADKLFILTTNDPITLGTTALTFTEISGGGGGVTDHGALTGLGDDDHPQYLRVDGTRAMTGTLDMGTFAITNVGNVDGRDVSADGTLLDAAAATLSSHVADTSIHFTEASIDHGSISGLSDDDHSQYALLAGRAGGQTLLGGPGSDDLTLTSGGDVVVSGANIIGASNTEDVGSISSPFRRAYFSSTIQGTTLLQLDATYPFGAGTQMSLRQNASSAYTATTTALLEMITGLGGGTVRRASLTTTAFRPNPTGTLDLGEDSTPYRWRDLYLSGDVVMGGDAAANQLTIETSGGDDAVVAQRATELEVSTTTDSLWLTVLKGLGGEESVVLTDTALNPINDDAIDLGGEFNRYAQLWTSDQASLNGGVLEVGVTFNTVGVNGTMICDDVVEVNGDFRVDSVDQVFMVDVSANRVGVGNFSPTTGFDCDYAADFASTVDINGTLDMHSQNVESVAKIGLGTTTSSTALMQTQASPTDTSGTHNTFGCITNFTPSATSSAAIRTLDSYITSAGTQTMTGTLSALRFLVLHGNTSASNTNSCIGIGGQSYLGFITPTAVKAGDVEGGNFVAGSFSNFTGTVATTFGGVVGAAAVIVTGCKGTFDDVYGVRGSLQMADASVTWTQAAALHADLSGITTGTNPVITEGFGLLIDAWPSGPAYGNIYGISQEGGTELNWLRGKTQVGGGSRPTSITPQLSVQGMLTATGLITGNGLDANSQKITSVATPTAGTDAVNKTYADSLGGGAVGDVNTVTSANAAVASYTTVLSSTGAVTSTGKSVVVVATARFKNDSGGNRKYSMQLLHGASVIASHDPVDDDDAQGNGNYRTFTIMGVVAGESPAVSYHLQVKTDNTSGTQEVDAHLAVIVVG